EVEVLADHVANPVGDHEQLKNAGPAIVAGAAAMGTDLLTLDGLFGIPGRLVEVLNLVCRQVEFAELVRVGLVTDLALRTQDTHQSLTEDGANGAGDHER